VPRKGEKGLARMGKNASRRREFLNKNQPHLKKKNLRIRNCQTAGKKIKSTNKRGVNIGY